MRSNILSKLIFASCVCDTPIARVYVMVLFQTDRKALLKMFVPRFSEYHCCETEGILPEKHCGSRPARSTVSMLFVLCRP